MAKQAAVINNRLLWQPLDERGGSPEVCVCFGENPPFWHRLAQLRAGSGSEGPARRYPARTQPGPWLSPRGRTDGEAERCSALRTPLLASFNPGTGRHGRSRDAVVPRARQRAPGRAEPPGRNSRGGRDGANAPRGSGSSGAPRTAPLCQRPRDALLLQERCGGGPGVGAAGAWESRALLAAASCSVGAGPARGSSRHRVPRAGLCPRPLPGSGPAGMGPRSRRKAPGLGSALRSPSPRAGGRAWRVGSGRGGAGTGAESRRAERAARAAEPLLCPQVCSARGGFAGRGGSPARPGPARFGSARLGSPWCRGRRCPSWRTRCWRRCCSRRRRSPCRGSACPTVSVSAMGRSGLGTARTPAPDGRLREGGGRVGSPDGGRCPARPAVPPARGRGLPSPAGTGCGARGAGWPPSTVGRSWPRRSGVETPCDSPRGSEPAQHSQPARQAGARCSVGAGSGEQRPGRVFASPCAGLWGRGRGQAGRGGLSTCSGCTAAAGVVACVTPPRPRMPVLCSGSCYARPWGLRVLLTVLCAGARDGQPRISRVLAGRAPSPCRAVPGRCPWPCARSDIGGQYRDAAGGRWGRLPCLALQLWRGVGGPQVVRLLELPGGGQIQLPLRAASVLRCLLAGDG